MDCWAERIVRRMQELSREFLNTESQYWHLQTQLLELARIQSAESLVPFDEDDSVSILFFSNMT